MDHCFKGSLKKFISSIISGRRVLFVRNDLCNSQVLGTTFINLGQSSVIFFSEKIYSVNCVFETNDPFTISKSSWIKPTISKEVSCVWRTFQREITSLLEPCEKLDDKTKYIYLKQFMGIRALSHWKSVKLVPNDNSTSKMLV